MAGLVQAAAAVPFAMAVTVIGVGVVRVAAAGRAGPAELAGALGLGLEFLLAAGLLRLSAVDDLAGLAAVAAIIAIRRLISTGIREGVRALGAAGIERLRA